MNRKSDVSGRLKAIRNKLGLKQIDFASRLNVSSPSLSEMESGKYKPNFDLIVNVVKEFNVNPFFLLLGKGEMFSRGKITTPTDLDYLSVDADDFKKLLWYFQRSPLVQYSVMSFFRSLLRNEARAVEEEIQESKERNKK